jgi:transcription elongation factor Elf1
MGRRRRKVVRVPKKRLPQIFLCPQCGKEAMHVGFSKTEEKASISCGNCGLSDELNIKRSYTAIDVYCSFTDKHYGKKTQRKPPPAQEAL